MLALRVLIEVAYVSNRATANHDPFDDPHFIDTNGIRMAV